MGLNQRGRGGLAEKLLKTLRLVDDEDKTFTITKNETQDTGVKNGTEKGGLRTAKIV